LVSGFTDYGKRCIICFNDVLDHTEGQLHKCLKLSSKKMHEIDDEIIKLTILLGKKSK